MSDDRPPPRPPSYDKKVGLVLQGGGALGSYQAGVYEALASSDYLPDWVAGISIGAINAAIIAGKCAEAPSCPPVGLLGGNHRADRVVAIGPQWSSRHLATHRGRNGLIDVRPARLFPAAGMARMVPA
jgi:hypothetical protein